MDTDPHLAAAFHLVRCDQPDAHRWSWDQLAHLARDMVTDPRPGMDEILGDAYRVVAMWHGTPPLPVEVTPKVWTTGYYRARAAYTLALVAGC